MKGITLSVPFSANRGLAAFDYPPMAEDARGDVVGNDSYVLTACQFLTTRPIEFVVDGYLARSARPDQELLVLARDSRASRQARVNLNGTSLRLTAGAMYVFRPLSRDRCEIWFEPGVFSQGLDIPVDVVKYRAPVLLRFPSGASPSIDTDTPPVRKGPRRRRSALSFD